MKEDTAELKTLESGGFTLKSFFSRAEAKDRLMNSIRESIPWNEVEINNLKLHSTIVTLQLAKAGIPFFQRSKFREFYKQVTQFSAREVNNNDKVLALFQEILGLNTNLIKDNVTFWREREADDNSRIISFNEKGAVSEEEQKYKDF